MKLAFGTVDSFWFESKLVICLTFFRNNYVLLSFEPIRILIGDSIIFTSKCSLHWPISLRSVHKRNFLDNSLISRDFNFDCRWNRSWQNCYSQKVNSYISLQLVLQCYCHLIIRHLWLLVTQRNMHLIQFVKIVASFTCFPHFLLIFRFLRHVERLTRSVCLLWWDLSTSMALKLKYWINGNIIWVTENGKVLIFRNFLLFLQDVGSFFNTAWYTKSFQVFIFCFYTVIVCYAYTELISFSILQRSLKWWCFKMLWRKRFSNHQILHFSYILMLENKWAAMFLKLHRHILKT